MSNMYVKKPVVVEAEHFTEENRMVCLAFAGDAIRKTEGIDDGTALVIGTLEGDLTVRIGDWIIKGVKGEFYPIRDDIFRETYIPAFERPKDWMEREMGGER